MNRLAPAARAAALQSAAILFAVLIFTRFGGLFTLPPTNISAFWPANALLFSGVFLLAERPARLTLLLALPTFFIAEIWIGYPYANAAVYSLANVAEVAVFLWLLRLITVRNLAFDNLKSLLTFLGLAAAISPVGGIIGGLATAVRPDGDFVSVLLRWSLADFFGYCLFAPLVLSWGARRRFFRFNRPGRITELAVLFMALLSVTAFSSGLLWIEVPFGAQFLPLPLLIWAALRFGPPGGAIATAIVAGIAFFSATNDVGLFAAGSPEENLESLQVFFASLMFSVMTIAALNAERSTTNEALRQSEGRYRTMFENSPVSIWEEDFSAIRALFDRLRREGVNDLDAHFAQHPESVRQCAELVKIVDVNQAARILHGANSKEELLAGLATTFTQESLETFRKELICLWRGDTQMRRDAAVKTLDGEHRRVSVNLAVCPGYETTLAKVFVSLIDITERKEAELKLKKAAEFAEGVINAIPDILFEVDVEGRYFNVWTRRPELLALSREELIGRTVNEVLPPDTAAAALAAIHEADVKGISLGNILRLDLPEGTHWFEHSLSKLPSDDPATGPRFLVLSRDITDRMRMEEELRASEQRFRAMFEQSFQFIGLMSTDGTLLEANNAALKFAGVEESEVLGKPFWTTPWWAHSPELQQQLQDVIRKAAAGEFIRTEITHQDKNGEIHDVDFSLTPVTDSEGVVIQLIPEGRDITELKKAEQERRVHAETLANMDRINRAIQSAGDLETMMHDVLDEVLDIFDCDRAYLLYPCNPAASSFSIPMECTRPEFPVASAMDNDIPMDTEISNTMALLLSNSDAVQFGPGTDHPIPASTSKRYGIKSFMAIAILPKTGKAWEFGIQQCSRSRVWSRTEEQLLDEIGRRLTDALTSLLVLRDLRKSEARYQQLFDTANEGIWIQDENYVTTFVNEKMAQMLGYTAAELQDRKVTDFMAEEDTLDHARKMEERSRNMSDVYERRLRHKDGRTVWMLISATPIIEDDGFHGSFAMLTDITDRKEAEQRLVASEQLFRTLVEHSPDFIARYDLNLRRIYVNPALKSQFNVPTEQVLGASPTISSPLTDPERYMGFIRQAIETAAECADEHTYRNTDGEIRWAHTRFVPEFDVEGEVASVMVISQDITQQKQVEKERRLHTKFLTAMDRINRAIQGALDLETLMGSVLDEVLDILDCDRAFLMYPCDPSADTWTVPMERTRPEYPGVGVLNEEIPMDEDVASTLKPLLSTPGAVKFGPETGHLLPKEISERFGIRSFLSVAVYPKVGKPWQFGIHQCSYDRSWSSEEEHILEEIGRRLAEGLTSLLILRDLRESEAKYRRIFDTAIEGIWGQDENFVTTFVNARMAEMLGYSVEELQGRPDTDFMFEEDVVDHQQKQIDRKQQLAEVYERRFRRKDGTTLWALVSATPIFDTEGAFNGSFAMVTDITERKRTEEEMLQSEQRLRLHAEQSPLGFLEWDESFRAAEWNAACEKIFGYTREEALGRYAKDLILPAAVRELVDGIYQDLMSQTGGTHSINENVTKDGRVITCEWFNTTLRNKDGKPIGVASICRDVTEQKQREDELQRYRNHLEDEVYQRTEELRLARDAAEAANKAKSAFLANMSHELRTPLNAILGFSHMMQQDAGLTESHHQTLDIINNSGEHLLKLINDVLEIAKIEAGKLQLEVATFDLHAMVLEVAEMMGLRAQEKGLELELDQSSEFPRYIKGDEARLRQILVNLVSNAVKFTEQGGVTIRLSIKDNTQHHLLIEVEDTGPGISEEDQQQLFKPFVQLPEGKMQVGTGLGLSIVYQFVKLMGGTIVVESSQDKGSLFRVELPLLEADEAGITRLSRESHGDVIGLQPGQPSYRILVTEDQRDNRQLLVKLMADIGMQVRAADDGEQCVRIFKEWKPDLIWMDQRMPVMDGVEATKNIRRLPGGDEVKIVAVTASAFKEQQDELLAAGMNGVVRKPFRFREIYDSMERQLGLEFIYREAGPEEIGPAPTLAPSMLAGIGEELQTALREALDTLDSERIEAVIRQIGEKDPDLEGVLESLADSFDYPAILAALDAAIANSRSGK